MTDASVAPQPDPVPSPDLVSVAGALVRAEARAAVAPLGFIYPDLLASNIAESLRCDAETMTVYVIDTGTGARRYGVTADMLAKQWMVEYRARQ
jgi:hypothetical protein